MMNLKLTISSWILFFIIFSSNTHAIPEPSVYSGQIVDSDDPSHPSQLCKNTLSEKFSYWSFSEEPEKVCSSNIKCRKINSNEEVELPQVPVNGVVCHIDFEEVDKNSPSNPKILACYNKKCLPVKE